MPETAIALVLSVLVSLVAVRRIRPIGPALGLVAVFAALTACSPLPGDTIDPMYGRLRGAPVSDAPPAASEAAPTKGAAPPPQRQAAPATPNDAGAGQWIGHYVDSRGAGEITMSLLRQDEALSGIWKLKTGGRGLFSGTLGTDGRVTFRMQSTLPNCPGTLDGWLEMHETTLVGAYHGQDCRGAITDGRFDARRQ